MPGFVREVGIGRYGIDFNPQGFEGVIVICEIAQFSRTNKGKVRGIEENNRPLTFERLFVDFDELSMMVGGCFEWLDFAIDD